MKQFDKHIEAEVEETLRVADRISPVAANPFLWTKIEAQLNRGRDNVPVVSFRWQLAVVASVVFLNIAFLSWDWRHQQAENTQKMTQSIWSEYKVDWTSQVQLTFDHDES